MAEINYINGYEIADAKARTDSGSALEKATQALTKANTNTSAIEDINSDIQGIESEIQNIGNGSPLVASSTAEMVDTTKIYVNTTDGKWYYYDGDSWEIGGTYQATGIEENSITYDFLDEKLQKQLVPLDMEIGEYSNAGKLYTGSIGSTISMASLNDWSCGVIEVTNKDILVIPYLPRGQNYGSAYLFFLTDEDDKILERYPYTTINQYIYDNAKPFILGITNNVKKVYFNKSNGQFWYPFIVKSYNYNDVRFTNSKTELITQQATSVISNKIYSLFSWDTTLAYYKTTVFTVSPLDKINITTTIPGNTYYVPIIYLDEDLKPVGYTKTYGVDHQSTTVTVDDIVPCNAKYAYCSTANDVNPVLKKYTISDISLDDMKRMSISYNDGTLTINNNINGNQLVFENYGGNNLFMIKSFVIGDTFKTVYTDMHPAPYIVKAINNVDGDKTSAIFTGGNHQWNNQGSGSTATARQISLDIYADGQEVSDGDVLNCDYLKIVEVNRVQGWNTCKEDGSGREILEEKIVFNFDGINLDVLNTIHPLEEIVIQRYYGIQTAAFNNNKYIIYSDKLYNVDTQYSVTKKPDAIYADGMVCSKMYNEGLGSYQYNTSNVKVNISNNKSYYAPIYDNLVSFDTNNKYYIRGKYIFDSNQS